MASNAPSPREVQSQACQWASHVRVGWTVSLVSTCRGKCTQAPGVLLLVTKDGSMEPGAWQGSFGEGGKSHSAITEERSKYSSTPTPASPREASNCSPSSGTGDWIWPPKSPEWEMRQLDTQQGAP